MTTPTNNPIPSSTAIDVRFNAEKLDEIINSDDSTFTDRFGNKRLTAAGMQRIVNEFGGGNISKITTASGWDYLGKVKSFSELRTLRPEQEGQRVLLSGYTEGSTSGAGEFIGHLTAGTDDGGTVAAGDGFFWKRESYNVTVLDFNFLLPTTVAESNNNNFFTFFNQTVAPNALSVPPGEYVVRRPFYSRGLNIPKDKFVLEGAGSNRTFFKHAAAGVGDIFFMDKLSNFKISGLTLDNSGMTTPANGQVWIRDSQDGGLSDVKFRYGDQLSYVLGGCTNIQSYDLKIDGQIRYPVGTSKSPLIHGDNSKQCMIIGGWVKAVGTDGVLYAGDLLDNDYSHDSKFAFINIYGLTYTQKANANVCFWSEGQEGFSNSHSFGMNLINNGYGRGISELSMGTDFGHTYRGAQVAGVWNRNYWFGFGAHFIDNAGENSGNSNITGAVYIDNAMFTISNGGFFKGNVTDFRDFSSATTALNGSSVQSIGDVLSSTYYVSGNASAVTSHHHGISNGLMLPTAKIINSGTRSHMVIVNETVVGELGQIGSNNPGLQCDIIGSTLVADTYTGALMTPNQQARIFVRDTVIRGYSSIIAQSSTNRPVFRECIFVGCTFTANDLSYGIYLNCTFTGCTNSPDTKGIAINADNHIDPSVFSTIKTFTAGESITFPTWAMGRARGYKTVKIEPTSAELPISIFTIAKPATASAGTVSTVYASTANTHTVSWPAGNNSISVVSTVAGSFKITVS